MFENISQVVIGQTDGKIKSWSLWSGDNENWEN